MIKVAKFGGSSCASAEQFKKVRDIVRADPDRRYVVVSAAGKRDDDDNKITDLLLLANAHIEYHVDSSALLSDIEARFEEIASELGLKFPVAKKFDEFASCIKSLSPEYVVSRGEWFTAQLMAEYLEMPFLDAADVMIFHHDGTVDMERTATAIRDAATRLGSFVLPGFYGTTVDGQIKLFQRGGGDISGAIVARCLDAGVYENWTDVSGFLAADPRIVDDPRTIHRITFDEMRELHGRLGAAGGGHLPRARGGHPHPDQEHQRAGQARHHHPRDGRGAHPRAPHHRHRWQARLHRGPHPARAHVQ